MILQGASIWTNKFTLCGALCIFFLLHVYGQEQEVNCVQRPVFYYNIDHGLGVNNVQQYALNEHQQLVVHNGNQVMMLDGPRFRPMNLPVNKRIDHRTSFYFDQDGLFYTSIDKNLYRYDPHAHQLDSFKTVYNYPWLLHASARHFTILDEGQPVLLSPTGDVIGTSQIPVLEKRESIHVSADGETVYYILPLKNTLYRTHLPSGQTDHITTHGSIPYKVVEMPDGTVIAILSDGVYRILFDRSKMYKIVNLPVESLNETTTSMCYWEDGLILIALNGALYMLDYQNASWLYEVRNFEGGPIVPDGGIQGICKDVFDNVYLITLKDGVVKVGLSDRPVRYFSSGEPSALFARNLIVDEIHNRIMHINFTNQISIYDTLGILQLRTEIDHGGNPKSLIGLFPIENHQYLALSANSDRYHILDLEKETPQWKEKEAFLAIPRGYYATELLNDSNSIWIQTERAILKFDKSTEQLEIHYLQTDIITTAILVNDKIYAGARGKLYVFDLNFDMLGSFDLWHGQIRDILSLDEDRLLLACNKGLYTLDVNTGSSENYGKVETCIYAIASSQDRLLASSNDGIFVLKNGTVIERITQRDHVVRSEYNSGAKAYGRDGRVYFGGVHGITRINTHQIASIADHTCLRIRSNLMSSDFRNGCVALGTSHQSVLQHGRSPLSVQLQAVGPAAPEHCNYQYKIEGITTGWVDLGLTNVISSTFNPGMYQIHYYAGTVFQENPLQYFSLALDIKGKWWESIYIKLIGIGLFCALLAQTYFRIRATRLRQRIHVLELEQQIEKQRLRMSRDLHDSVGVQVSMIKRTICFIQDRFKYMSEKKIMNELSELSSLSSEITQSLRNIIWATRQDTFTAEDLVQRIGSLLFRLDEHEDKPRFSFSSQLSLPNVRLPSMVALNAFRIVQEALHNAVKHSEALSIKVRCSDTAEGLYIMIADTGIGFDSDQEYIHGGIANIKQRAQESGLDVQIISGPDRGTTISLTVHKKTMLQDEK